MPTIIIRQNSFYNDDESQDESGQSSGSEIPQEEASHADYLAKQTKLPTEFFTKHTEYPDMLKAEYKHQSLEPMKSAGWKEWGMPADSKPTWDDSNFEGHLSLGFTLGLDPADEGSDKTRSGVLDGKYKTLEGMGAGYFAQYAAIEKDTDSPDNDETDGSVNSDDEEGSGMDWGMEALELVRRARQNSYGHPLLNFGRHAQYLNTWLRGRMADGEYITPVDISMMSVLGKIAREQNNHKRDNPVDMIGYVLTYNEIDAAMRRLGYEEGAQAFDYMNEGDFNDMLNRLETDFDYYSRMVGSLED